MLRSLPKTSGWRRPVLVCPEEKFATDSFFLDGMEREFSEDGRVLADDRTR